MLSSGEMRYNGLDINDLCSWAQLEKIHTYLSLRTLQLESNYSWETWFEFTVKFSCMEFWLVYLNYCTVMYMFFVCISLIHRYTNYSSASCATHLWGCFFNCVGLMLGLLLEYSIMGNVLSSCRWLRVLIESICWWSVLEGPVYYHARHGPSLSFISHWKTAINLISDLSAESSASRL